jgi:hypothetical protein
MILDAHYERVREGGVIAARDCQQGVTDTGSPLDLAFGIRSDWVEFTEVGWEVHGSE